MSAVPCFPSRPPWGQRPPRPSAEYFKTPNGARDQPQSKVYAAILGCATPATWRKEQQEHDRQLTGVY